MKIYWKIIIIIIIFTLLQKITLKNKQTKTLLWQHSFLHRNYILILQTLHGGLELSCQLTFYIRIHESCRVKAFSVN